MENQKNEKHLTSRRKKVITFWSIVLVVVAFFFLKNAGFLTSVYLSSLFTWPIILFCIAIICLLKREWVMGIVLLATAKFFWLPILLKADPQLCPCISSNGFIHRYWYLLVIFIAIVIILQQIFAKETKWDKKFKYFTKETKVHEIKDGFIRSAVVFSSNEKMFFNEDFKGGKFDTVFGSQEIDLRKCIIPNKENAFIEIEVVFGSCMVWIPTDWSIQINTENVFSSVEDKRLQTQSNNQEHILVINGKCVFSRLEIRN
jgi:predicted membrane protein